MDKFDELRQLCEAHQAVPHAAAPGAIDPISLIALIKIIASIFIKDASIIAIIEKVVEILGSLFPKQP